MLQLYRK